MTLKASDEFTHAAAPAVATTLSVILVISFGLYVLYYIRVNSKDNTTHFTSPEFTLETFLTARHSVSALTIGWSFFASAVGSWVITGPAEYGYYVGILGTFAYAFASAFPILLISLFGPMMQAAYPSILSLSDFVLWRFGRCTQILVVCVTVLNMSITATAEYTTLTSLYSDFVGLQDFTVMFIILVALVTLTYTTIGGLKASIITDQAQAVVALFLVQVIVIYLVADFNREEISAKNDVTHPNSTQFEFSDYIKGLNKSGHSSLFTLPFSLSTATIFSEAFWQRSWAAYDAKALRKGAFMAFGLIFIVVGTFGATGVLVAWADLVDPSDLGNFNSNLFAFQVFSKEAGQTVVSSGIGVLVLLLAATMSESAIDSLQSGISASINGAMARLKNVDPNKKSGLLIGRVVLVCINIPYIFIGLQKYNILSLFLIANMVCVCAFFPITLGFLKSPTLNKYQRDWIPPLNFVSTVFATMVYGGIKFGSFSKGVRFAFWENFLYEYEYFLFPLIATIIITFLLLGVSFVIENYVKIKGQDEKIPVEQSEKDELGTAKSLETVEIVPDQTDMSV